MGDFVAVNRQALAKAVGLWFEETARDRNRWGRDLVGVAIKGGLVRTGNWKNRARGNYGKGFRVMKG